MAALAPASNNTGSWASPGSNLALLTHVHGLIQQGLHDSAVILGQFFVTEARRHQSSPGSDDARLDLIDALVLLGDGFAGKGEFRRAIAKYEDALQTSQLLRHCSAEPRIANIDEMRMKIAQAHVRLKTPACNQSSLDSVKLALEALEPIQHKTASCWNLMATLYERLGRVKTASAAYQKVLDANPMAISAAIAIIRLGGDAATVSSFYKKSPHAWIAQLLTGHASATLHEHRSALAAFSHLNLQFPNTHHVLIHRARTQLHLSDADAARSTFELAHRCDPFALEYMDMYAWVLRMRGKASELGVLTQTLLSLDQTSPQPWIAVALYCDQRGEREKAVKFLDKAIAMAPRHLPSYLVKGFISLAMGCAEVAVQSYKQAFQIDRRELDAYAGLVESYLALPQFNDALYIAKAAVQALPRNARALTLFGTVLSRSPEGRDKAVKAFKKALSIDPKCVDAVLGLSKLYIGQKQFSEAIALLEQHLAHQPSDVMHTKLAGVYAQSGNIDRALIHYHTALSMSPESRTALAGIERLEAALKERAAAAQPTVLNGHDIDFEPVYQ